MAQGTGGLAVKGALRVRKWHPGSDPERDPPDEIVTTEQWIEGGAVVTDPVRIAELEARASEQKGKQS